MVLNINFAQTFYIEPDLKDTVKIKLTGFDLFFKYKPDAINNRSGIVNPGITAYLTETIYDVPIINETTYQNYARAEWTDIPTSSDATRPTLFRFPNPIEVTGGKMYALAVAFDGNESYWPWVAKVGSWIVGSERVIYSGPSGNMIGKYYEYISTDTQNDPTTARNQAEYMSYWRPLNDTTLKFQVNAARYWISGVSVINANLAANVILYSNNLIQQSNGIYEIDFLYPAQQMEHVTFDLASSSVMNFLGAQRVFQNTVPYPGGYANGKTFHTVSCNETKIITANTNLPNGMPFSWNNVFGSYTGLKFITLFSAEGDAIKNVRMVQSILSNTELQVTEPVTFTNNITKFIIAPTAMIDSLDTNSPEGKTTEFMMLAHSSANASVRFVNNCIEAITVAPGAGGSGYNNSQILYIKGYQDIPAKVAGGYVAVANIVTNSTGGITNVYLSNLGCGFVNNAQIAIVAANGTAGFTANTSNGTGASFTYTIGSTLQAELTNNTFKNCEFVNLDINDATPYFDVFCPPNCTFDLKLRTMYYVDEDPSTYNGYVYHIFPGMQRFDKIQLLKRNRFLSDKQPVFMSYSNEFNTLYSNGSMNDQVNALSLSTNNYMLQLHATSNNDWVIVTTDTVPTIEFGKYIYNNSEDKEYTNFGNCWAKHVVTRNNFARLSEDIRVYLEAYRPANTELAVYARIQNSGDPDAFDDLDWTRLRIIDEGTSRHGNTIYSSSQKEDDYIELAYGFQSYPNTAFRLAGSVATTNGSSNIVGSGTTFNSNLVVGDMVRIYDPLFPTTNFIVSTVTAVTSASQITIDQPILAAVNPALVQGGMKIDKLAFPHQGYNNITFDNVSRYYNTSLVKYDGYDTLQIKVLLMSSQLGLYPKIHSIRGVGVSA